MSVCGCLVATRTCSYWFEPASCSAGGSRQEAFINKEAYEEWQSKVVAAFYEEGSRCTELFPQTGAPSVLRKRKFILYALEDTAKTARLVELKSGDLPEKTSLMMYHVGSQTLDFVSRGFKEGVFSHPACDLGGLSNYKQKPGEAADFTGEPMNIKKNCNLSEQSKAICRQWQALAQAGSLFGIVRARREAALPRN